MSSPSTHSTKMPARPPSLPGEGAPSPAITTPGMMAGPGALPLAIPLPYLLSGMLMAAIFGLSLPWIAPDALEAPEVPHVLALVHTATLGWLTMVILGASLQLTPVILVAPLRASRLLRWQYPVFTAGVLGLVIGFWLMRPWLVAAGGVLVALAVAHHAVVMSATLAGAARRPLTARYLAASTCYLCLVVGLGLTAALNLQLGFLGIGITRLLPAHIALSVIGWLTTTLMGVSYTLVRMFALAHGHGDRLGRWIFVLLNAGIAILAIGLGLASTLVLAAGGCLLAGAVWLFAWDYAAMLRRRRRKPLDVTQRHGIAALAYLVAVVPAGVVVTLLGVGRPPVLATLALAAFVGWLGQSTVGYLYKVVPFLIWHRRFGPLAGRRKVPLMRDLVHARWAEASWWLINAGLPAALLFLLLDWEAPLRLASSVLGAGLALAAANIVDVTRRRPPTP